MWEPKEPGGTEKVESFQAFQLRGEFKKSFQARVRGGGKDWGYGKVKKESAVSCDLW